MSKAPDKPPPVRECLSPTESLSNFTDNHRLSPNDIFLPTPTDLDTTETNDESFAEEYLEIGSHTPTDIDTTDSVDNITNESVTVLTVTNNNTEAASPQRNVDSVTPPISEESVVDDSVADPDFEISKEPRIGNNSPGSDRTITISNEETMNSENLSPSVLNSEPDFDTFVHDNYRTSTPLFVITQNENQGINNIDLPENIARTVNDQNMSIERIDSPSLGLQEQNVLTLEFNGQHNIEPEVADNGTENLQEVPGILEESRNYSKSERRLSKKLEKTAEHINKLKSKHPICLNICTNCPNKCNDKFSEVDRRYTWNVYWNLNYTARRKWLAACVKSKNVQRRRVRITGDNHRKKETRIYVLPKDDMEEKVCLSFFLKTLGYISDSVITELRKACKKAPLLSQVQENRGRKKNSKKCDYSLVKAHINSFHPCTPHYRRHNAPNVRYMPMGVTLKYLYSDFASKLPGVASKETYRKVLSDLGISLFAPDSDICADCAYYDKLKKECQERGENVPEDEKEKHVKHVTKSKEATEEYNKDKLAEEGRLLKIYSMDLEKVILLFFSWSELEMHYFFYDYTNYALFNALFIGKYNKNMEFEHVYASLTYTIF